MKFNVKIIINNQEKILTAQKGDNLLKILR